jgi:hypothetical protein
MPVLGFSDAAEKVGLPFYDTTCRRFRIAYFLVHALHNRFSRPGDRDLGTKSGLNTSAALPLHPMRGERGHSDGLWCLSKM